MSFSRPQQISGQTSRQKRSAFAPSGTSSSSSFAAAAFRSTKFLSLLQRFRQDFVESFRQKGRKSAGNEAENPEDEKGNVRLVFGLEIADYDREENPADTSAEGR